MAEGRRMTIAREAVEQLMASKHGDVLRESVAWMVAELMEAEVAAQIGAELGERAPEERTTQRNGYRPRGWDTRVGEIELQIPKLRQGSYFPSVLEPRKRLSRASWRSCRRPTSTASRRGRFASRSAERVRGPTSSFAPSANAS